MECTYGEELDHKKRYEQLMEQLKNPNREPSVVKQCPLGLSVEYSMDYVSLDREIFRKAYRGDEAAAVDAMNRIEMADPDVLGLVLQMLQLIKKAKPEEIAVLCNLVDYLRNMRTEATQERESFQVNTD